MYKTRGEERLRFLAMEINRLKMITSHNSRSSAQFWLGFIAASSSMPIEGSKSSTLDDWKQLTEKVHFIIELSDSQVIEKDNLCQLFAFAVNPETQQYDVNIINRLNVKKVNQQLHLLMNQLCLNNNYLKDKISNHNSEKKESIKEPIKQLLKQSQPQIVKPKQEEKQSAQLKNFDLGIQCPICLSSVTLQDVCPVSCGHNLHKNCLIEHFKSKVEEKKFPICCPEDGCSFQIVIQDLQQYIPTKLLQKYYEFCLHQFVDKNKKSTSWCPTAGCSAVFEHDGALSQYRCVACKKHYCLSCKTESHPGIKCELNRARKNVSEEEKQFIKFAQGAKMKQCPSCLFWVQKNKGCDHMTCRCGYEFCFRCGAKYGQGECNCDERDSFYGNDEQDENQSQGLDFQDDIQIQLNEGRNSFIPERAHERMHRIAIQRIQRPRVPIQVRYQPINYIQTISNLPSSSLHSFISSNMLRQIRAKGQQQQELSRQRRRRIPFASRSRSISQEQIQLEDWEEQRQTNIRYSPRRS